jgi:hypothetical protein
MDNECSRNTTRKVPIFSIETDDGHAELTFVKFVLILIKKWTNKWLVE